MARRITPSQFRSTVRQAESRQRQAIAKFNQAVSNYNRQVRAHYQKVKQAIDNYNGEVRAYNARVRANRQRVKTELARLERQGRTPQYVTFRTSVETLHRNYVRLEERAESHCFDAHYNEMLDLSEREAANSLAVMNALLQEGDEALEAVDPQASELTDELKRIAPDLDSRWRGALYALNPRNPDAARHFCTSAREIITAILDLRAPDVQVLEALQGCEQTEDGRPTRRSKIRYFLHCKTMEDEVLEEFVERDIDNVVTLFRTFNDGTHGSAGTFGLPQLGAIRKRVENAIMFLSRIVS